MLINAQRSDEVRIAIVNGNILDTYEAGIVLTGSEVKSLREGNAQIAEGYARVQRGEMWLDGIHIPPYTNAIGFGAHDPDRSRKLLLHRDEIRRLQARIDQERMSVVPLSLYFRDGKVAWNTPVKLLKSWKYMWNSEPS